MLSYTPINEWVSKLPKGKVLLLSDRDLAVGPHLFGEDYYISKIMAELQAIGIDISLAMYKDGTITYNSKKVPDLLGIIDKGTVIILHNVSPSHVVRFAFFKRARIIMPLYYYWNNAVPLSENLKNLFGDLIWQPFMYQFIISSPEEICKFRHIGLFKKITPIFPEYKCTHCDLNTNLKKKEALEHQMPNVINVVYIGSLKPKRFPIERIIAKLNSYKDHQWHLTIYTTSHVVEKTTKQDNVEVTYLQKILTAEEKCQVLQKADAFVGPAKNTTMQPPLSIIEAKYHGNLIINY